MTTNLLTHNLYKTEFRFISLPRQISNIPSPSVPISFVQVSLPCLSVCNLGFIIDSTLFYFSNKYPNSPALVTTLSYFTNKYPNSPALVTTTYMIFVAYITPLTTKLEPLVPSLLSTPVSTTLTHPKRITILETPGHTNELARTILEHLLTFILLLFSIAKNSSTNST